MSAQLTINFGAISSTLIKNSVKTFALSKRFTKYMMKCSIFNILANRLVVNEADLKERHLETVPFFTLKRSRKNVKDPHFQRFLKWVNGIEDSIEQGFLKEVFLFMKDVQKNDILESYKFKLKYNVDKESCTNISTLSNENVLEQVLEFLKLVKELGTQQKLDESTVVELEFKYNDHTPFDYEPPGFKFADQPTCTSIKYPFDTDLGAINTGYHQLSCMGRKNTFKDENNKNSNMTRNKKEKRKIDTNIEVSKDDDAETIKAKGKKFLNISNVTVSLDDSIISVSSGKAEENVTGQHTNCICLIDLPEAETIYCSSCKNMLHIICCGFLTMPESEFCTKYCCSVCDPNNTRISSTLQDEARLRLLLYYIKKGALESILSLMPNDASEGYMQLKEVNIIHEDNTVDEAMLEHLISVMFKEPNSQLLDA